MSNSSLISYTKLSPNNSGKRTHAIDRITPHCVVGQCSVETLGSIFAKTSRQASCNYGIGKDGRVGLYVDEGNRSWCSSSRANDQRAVTIECASDTTAPYAFNNSVYNKLILLCTDICRRNGKKKLIWISDKTKALAYEPADDEMLLTVHRWFAKKSCPGDWMMARMDDLAVRVTSALGGNTATTTSETVKVEEKKEEVFKSYLVRVTANSLYIRKGPGTNFTPNGTITDKGVYTIVEESDGTGAKKWGKLKSGKGWISLDWTTKV